MDAAKVILQRGLDRLGIYLDAVPRVPRKQDKSTPEEPVGRQGKSSALVAEPGNPKIVPAIGVIGVEGSLSDRLSAFMALN